MRQTFRLGISKTATSNENLLKINFVVRYLSTDKDSSLSKHKLVPKPLENKHLIYNQKNELTKSLKKDDRRLLARLLDLPEKTPALRDEIPDVLKDSKTLPIVRKYAKFYNNLIIYDFPKLPPVKHKDLAQIKSEYHGMKHDELTEDTIWLPLFRMPGIPTIRAVGRFKLYLTGISGYYVIKEIHNLFTVGISYDLMPALSLAAITFGSLICLGSNLSKLVVQIYSSEDQKHLRFCRFTFYGRRRDIIVPIECVQPLTETNPTMRMPFYKLNFSRPQNLDLDYDYHEFYNVDLRICALLGGMRDRELFEAVLGKLLRNKPGA